MPKLIKITFFALSFVFSLSSAHIPSLNASIYLSHPETSKINITKTITQMAENGSDYDKDQLEILSNPASYSAEELQGASDHLIKSIASKYGYSDDELNDLKLIVYNDLSDNDAGFREKDKPANEGTIGLNAAHTGLGTDAYYFTLGHEFGHLHQAQDGAEQNEAYSDTVGNAFIHSINDGLYVGGMDSVNTRFFSTGLEDSGNYLFTYGNNSKARLIVQRDPYLFTAIDILSLGMGINNIKKWDEKTSFSERLADAGGVLLDAGGLFFPGTLAVGMQLTAYRAASKLDDIVDVAKIVNKVDDVGDVARAGKNIAVAADDVVGGIQKADFYVTPEGQAVPSTGYRYFSSSDGLVDDIIKNDGVIPEYKNNYFTFDKLDDAATTPGKLQVEHNAAIRVEFDTLPHIENIQIPKGKGGNASYLEPITKDYPDLGSGGVTQGVIPNSPIQGREIKNIQTGEILFQKK